MKKRVNIYLDEALHKQLKIKCIKAGTNVSQKVTELIKNEVAKD